ncbi:leucine rich adaptor protein 1-like [Centroberyx affinis]|uniref:leucine rich adaptor protein 1-like n=1 Tax=Centroberyx affinis TaxID=166261 RepID=UPI003A5C0574
MAEEMLNDSFPDLRELENKVGIKTPESLLIWMKDAAHSEDSWSSDAVERGDHGSLSDSFSDKLRNLKQEMKWLRSADVRILRQLVAVHEGIEAMRWLMEERGTLASRGSSLTGSQSSLVTVEGPWASMSPCRESPSPVSLQDPNDTTAVEESADPALDSDNDVPNHNSYFDMRSHESTEARPPSPSGSKCEVSCSAQGGHGQARSSTSPATASSLVSATSPKLQPQVSDAAPLQDFKSGAEPFRRALVRSRRGPKGGAGSFPKESLGACKNSAMEEERSMPSREEALLGYDAQWCWVESQDDVTFL